jgi:hypothetical protein
MKTLIAALALLSFAAGPVFAQTIVRSPQPGYYGTNPDVYVSPNLWTTSREGLVQAN